MRRKLEEMKSIRFNSYGLIENLRDAHSRSKTDSFECTYPGYRNVKLYGYVVLRTGMSRPDVSLESNDSAASG